LAEKKVTKKAAKILTRKTENHLTEMKQLADFQLYSNREFFQRMFISF